MPGICIVRLGPLDFSDTFLSAHCQHLADVAAVITQQHGVPCLDERPMLGNGLAARVARAARRRLIAHADADEVEQAYVEAIRRARCDVVLAEFGPAAAIVLRPCEVAGAPLVAHFHGYDAWDEATVARHRDAYARLFDRATAIVSGCRSMTARLVALGADRSKVITNYVSTVIPEEFPEIACDSRPPRFVAVGRFVEKKAPHLTLLAFAKAVVECPDLTLCFIGEGPLLGACRQLALTLGIADKVTFLGAQGPDVVRAEMQAARGFVQHSVAAPGGDREGTGISTLEAAMTGLGICATRHEGIAETMIDGVTALLVDEYDVDGMARHMAAIGNDPALARSLGQAASAHVRRHFTMQHSLDRLSRLLSAVARHEPVDQVRLQIEQEWFTGTGMHPGVGAA